MITVCNDQHALHQGRLEMYRGAPVPCFEVAARVDEVLAELGRRGMGAILPPEDFDESLLTRVHAVRYIDFLRGAWDEWVGMDPSNAERDIFPSCWPVRGFRSELLPDNFAARMGLFSFDTGTPFTRGTWAAARAGAGCALSAASRLLAGQAGVFALTRPPGHHAGADYFGGYCFINNAAVAAQALRDGGARRIAVLDVDYHHGNGTQSIFYDRADVLFASIHGDPRTEYPFFLGHADETGAEAGEGFNLNIPLPRGTCYRTWADALHMALRRIVGFRADALVVSLGVDTFAGDPISRFALESEDFLCLGEAIAMARLPTMFVFEGGYAVAEVGVNTVNVLEGFQQAVR